MNLSATIELYAGGPGSGCNPEVGKCGRPTTLRSDPSQKDKDLMKEYKLTHTTMPMSKLVPTEKKSFKSKEVIQKYVEDAKQGKLRPIEVVKTGEIVDGHHRYYALKKMGYTGDVPVMKWRGRYPKA